MDCTAVGFLDGNLELLMLLFKLLSLGQAAGDGEARHQHRLRVLDPSHHLCGISLKGCELNTLLKLDPTNGGQVLHVDGSFLNKLEENLNPGLSVVLRVRHQADPASLKHLEQILTTLNDIVGGGLYVRHLLVHRSHRSLSLAQLPRKLPCL